MNKHSKRGSSSEEPLCLQLNVKINKGSSSEEPFVCKVGASQVCKE